MPKFDLMNFQYVLFYRQNDLCCEQAFGKVVYSGISALNVVTYCGGAG